MIRENIEGSSWCSKKKVTETQNLWWAEWQMKGRQDKMCIPFKKETKKKKNMQAYQTSLVLNK